MRIAVLSDTHDQAELIEQAVEQIDGLDVGMVVHCGDWVSPFALRFFSGLRVPLKGVFGNNDGDKFRHAINAHSWGIDLHYEERFLSLDVDGRKIAVFHGD